MRPAFKRLHCHGLCYSPSFRSKGLSVTTGNKEGSSLSQGCCPQGNLILCPQWAELIHHAARAKAAHPLLLPKIPPDVRDTSLGHFELSTFFSGLTWCVLRRTS